MRFSLLTIQFAAVTLMLSTSPGRLVLAGDADLRGERIAGPALE